MLQNLIPHPAVFRFCLNSVYNISRSIHCTRINTTKTIIQRTKAPKEEKLKFQDQIKESFQLIYRAPLENYLKAANIATTLSAFGVGSIVIYNWYTGNVSYPPETFGERVELVADETDLLTFAVGFIALCVSIQVMVHRYPLRIYKNRSKYIAMFQGQMPFTKRRIDFVKGDVQVVPPKGVLPWKDSRYTVNNSRILLMTEYFKTPSELTTMLSKKKE